MSVDARPVSFAFACLPVCVCFILFFTTGKPGDDHFFCKLKNVWEERKNNRDANQVDEGRSRRASILLPINPLKINTSRFDSIATRWG